MRNLFRALVSLVALSAVAEAQHNTGNYLEFVPTTSGNACPTGHVCLWYDSGSLSYMAKNAAGGSAPVIAGTTYSVVEQSGTPLTQENVINFSGGGVTCTDNGVSHRTDCVIAGGGGGGAAGLSPAYNGGSIASDQTMLIQAGKGGAAIFKANGAATGDLVLVEDSSGNKIVDITDNSGFHFLADNPTSGGLNVAYNFDTVADLASGGGTSLWRFNTNGHKIFLIEGSYGASQLTWFDSNPAALAILGTMSFATSSPFGQINSFGPDGPNTLLDIDTVHPITDATARLVSIGNAGVEQAYFSPNGDLHLPVDGTIYGIPNVLVQSHVILDANTARLVAQNAVVNASNASGTLVSYTPWTIGVEFISDGVDFYNSGIGDIMILDNTGTVSTFALAPGLTGANNVQLGKPLRPFSALFTPLIYGGDPAAGFGAIGFSVGEADFYANASGSPVFFIVNGELGPYVANTALGSLTREWLGLYNNGPLSCSYNTQAGASYTAVVGDCYVGLSNAGARAVTMMAASAVPPGQVLEFKDEAGTAGGANVTITRAGADTIDGATTYVIATNRGAVVMRSDGTSKWEIVAKF